MPEIPTVEIHSPKDPSQKWIINQEDFDAAIHTLWDEPVVSQEPEPVVTPEPPTMGMRPSVPDFVHNDDGDIVAVNIINPEHRNARLQIAYEDYDPAAHDLWSTHSRFR